MIAWTTIQAAIHAWVAGASGLGASKVMWSGQNAPRPGAPYVELRLTNLQTPGIDATDIRDNATPSQGAEIEHISKGPRLLTLSITCYAASAVGANMPMAILELIKAKLMLPSYRDILETAQIGVGAFQPMTDLGTIMNTVVFEPRAMMSVRLFVQSEAIETGSNIESATVTFTVT